MPKNRGAKGRFLPVTAAERDKTKKLFQLHPDMPIPKLALVAGLSHQTLARISQQGRIRLSQKQLRQQRKKTAKESIKKAIQEYMRRDLPVSIREIAKTSGYNRELVRSTIAELKKEGLVFRTVSNNFKEFEPDGEDIKIIRRLKTDRALRAEELAEELGIGLNTLRKRITLLKMHGYLPGARRGYKKD